MLSTPDEAGEGDGREILGLCHADPRVCGYEVLLGLADVGTPFEQLRRQAGGHDGQYEVVEGLAPRDRSGIASKEHAQGVLLLADQFLEEGHGGQGRLVLRLRLAKLQLGDEAPVEAKLE